MPFALDSNPSISEISEAVNYILANLGAGTPPGQYPVNNDPTTGFISNTVGTLIQYQYRYLDVKYADNTAGLNFSDNPYGRLYFGLYNDDTVTESVSPSQYTWFLVTGGFGATKTLWVVTAGGRHATFAASQEAPDLNQNWRLVPLRSIDLDNPFKPFDQWMNVKFADDPTGAGLSDSPTNKFFYGLATSTDNTISVDPTDYEFSPFTFSTTNQLFYRTFGGRNISFVPSVNKPIGYLPYIYGTTINLDVTTLGAMTDIGIISTDPLIVESPFRYLLIRYGTSSTGTSSSNDPAGKTYFGLQASDIIALDTNPANYTWFAAGGTFITDVFLWVRTTGGNTAQFNLSIDAPDNSGWLNQTTQTITASPYVDVYRRTGSVVVNVSSPTSGRIGFSNLGANGVVNLNLDPYGQGRDTAGYSFDPASTSTIEVDEFGRIVQAAALDTVRYSTLQTTATAGQTAFSFSNTQPNQILVFRNGCFLDPNVDYTRTSTTVTLASACALNDVIQMYYIRLIDASTSADKVPFVVQTETLVNGQTIIPSTNTDGAELLLLNGVLIVDSDYDYIGTNQGYELFTPSVGGNLNIVVFAFNNANALIFSENYTQTTFANNNVVFPTQFARNSHLMWFCGALIRAGTDYTMAGVSDFIYTYTIIGALSFSGQPSQFVSFRSAGEASASSISAAGVLGMDMPIYNEHKPSMKELFADMQKELEILKSEIAMLKGAK
jgi:hypothetical protein